jgi:tetratricopeptide (TPR) repeat protein
MTEQLAAQEQYTRWLDEIRGIGGANPLTNLDLDVLGLVNLEKTHPVGLTLFTKSHRGLLANLVRDPIAYSKAIAEARHIKIKSDRLASNFGLQSTYLLAGAIDFRSANLDLRIPVMMWRAVLIRKGSDFELVLEGDPFVNPELIITLKKHYQIDLDITKLLKLYSEANDLVPITLLSFLAEATNTIPEFEIQRTLVLTNAVIEPTLMLHELPRTPNSFVTKIAQGEFIEAESDDLPPVLLAADSDSNQTKIVSRALAGDSFAVEALPGTGYTQTVANILGALSAEGKRALVLAPRRQTINELSSRLTQLGLSGLMVRSYSAWLDIVSAISRYEKATPANLQDAKLSRNLAAERLAEYQDSLTVRHPVLGISISDALAKLADLSALPKAPKTNARIAGSALFETRNRSAAIALLQEAVQLGEFELSTQSSPWANARFDDPAEVPRVISLASRLADEVLPAFGERLDDIAKQVHFPEAINVAQWGEYLRLLVSIRATLDRFRPEVFDRPITDLITATSPRGEKTGMSGKTKRALSKHAKEYVRAGVSVSDLHSALLQIREQSEQWKKLCSEPISPNVPAGLDDSQVIYQSLLADLIKLDSHLDPELSRLSLIELPISELSAKLRALTTETGPLGNLVAKNDLRKRIQESGLTSLVRSLAANGARNESLIAEFDQCWWLSALEYLLVGDNAFTSYTPELLAQLETEFVRADLHLMLESRKEIAFTTATRWHRTVELLPQEVEKIRALLKQRVSALPALTASARKLWPALVSHVATSPYELPVELLQEKAFDVVIIMDGSGTTIAENLSGLMRAKQVIAFGDPMIAEPNGFEVEWQLSLKARAPEAPSAFDVISSIFGREVLKRSYRLKGQLFSQLINKEFYQGRLEVEPTANEFDGKSSLDLVIVDGEIRTLGNKSASTESPVAEVNKVIELVMDHVRHSPEQSLLVVSASSIHAENLHIALQEAIDSHPDLMEFFEKHGREKFEIATLADLNHRLADRIIFTIGFGRTAQGKLLSHFGLLNEPEARRWLANMLVSARYSLTIVSCFSAYDLPELGPEGATAYLSTLLRPIYNDTVESDTFDSDPMLADLSRRLKRFGIRVVEGFGERIPLVASFGNQSLIVEPDWANLDLSVTERIRLRPQLLKSLGWGYQRVYSFEVFSDPQAVAERIALRLGVEITPTMLNTMPVARVHEDTDAAWGDSNTSNDDRLRNDKPPHWG